MKKFYTSLCAVLAGAALAGAANLSVVFNGNDNAGWTIKDNEYKIVGGHMEVTMGGPDANGKYRADIQYAAPEEGDGYTVLRYVAVKFMGTRPQGNAKLEVSGADGWLKKYDEANDKWNDVLNNPDGSIRTNSGNTVYYYDLTKASNFDASVFATKINFKIADNTQAPHEYTIDWIKTFATVEDIEADKNWQDDGANDTDEAIVAASPVVNETTGTGFTALEEALNLAADGDVLVINEDQTLPNSRLGIGEKALTVKAGKEGVKIIRGRNDINILINNKANVAFEGITFDGAGMTPEKFFIEVNGAQAAFKNVKFQNFNHFKQTIQAKASGKLAIENVEFDVLGETGDIFIGSAGSTITGNNNVGLYLENVNTIAASELTNTTPIVLFFDAEKRADAPALVTGWTTVDNFKSGMAGYVLKAGEEAIEFTEGDNPAFSGVEDVAAEAPATVNVYTMQGVLVRSGVAADEAAEGLSTGLYIIGGKKVYVK